MEAKAGMKNLCRQRMSKRSSPRPRRTTDCRLRRADKYEASYSRSQNGSLVGRNSDEVAGKMYILEERTLLCGNL